MDEECIMDWVKKILQPYVATVPLILDSYHCHMMGSVSCTIQDFGVQVKDIP